ncbi:MAG: hypothetical protein AAF587_37300 [Bacteroidota bacterium]
MNEPTVICFANPDVHTHMLDLNHPHSALIFEASAYLDRIKEGCLAYVVQSYPDRQTTFVSMRKECEGLSEFAITAFPNQREAIQKCSELIIAELDLLAGTDQADKPGCCRQCNQPLMTIPSAAKGLPELTICNNCPKKIYQHLSELEQLTGVIWI